MQVNEFVEIIKEQVLSALIPLDNQSAYFLSLHDDGKVKTLHEVLTSFKLKKLEYHSRFVYASGRYVFKFEAHPVQNKTEAKFYSNNPKSFYLNGRKVTFPKFIGSYWNERLIVTTLVKSSTCFVNLLDRVLLEKEMQERFGISDLWGSNVSWHKSRIVVVDCGHDST